MRHEQTDAELLGAWRAGDARAGSELVERHARTVLRFFRRKLDHGAEDLTQRTFLAAVEGRDRVRCEHGFRAYILGIARHEYIRAMKRGGRGDQGVAPVTQTSPSLAVARAQDRKRLLVALRQLPLSLQITLELFYWEDMTTPQIAAVLDVAPGTVKWRLSNARDRLAAALEALPAEARPATADDLGRWLESMRAAVEGD